MAIDQSPDQLSHYDLDRGKSGKMTLTFNPKTYSQLLAEIAPKVIETDAEYDRALAIAEKLTFDRHKTPEQRSVYQLLVILIETYENQHFPIPTSPPHEVLQHILEASGIQSSDLVGKLGSTEVVSEIINGQRTISKAQAQVLSDMFKVSPSLFT
jgi:HTH-type transcriptional regulator / antitoxin HigA